MSNVDHTLFEIVLRNTLIDPQGNVKYASLRRPLSQLVDYDKTYTIDRDIYYNT